MVDASIVVNRTVEEFEVPRTTVCCPSVLSAPLAADDAAALAHGFAALADPVRLRLINLLGAAPEGEVCVCNLTEPLGKSQPTISVVLPRSSATR
jgi:ArsR family transcriptional regulator